MPAHQWRAEAIDLLLDQRRRFADDETTQRNARARDWVKDIEQKLIALTARTIAGYGAPVTEKLLERLRAEMKLSSPSCRTNRRSMPRWADQVDQAVSAVLAPTNEALQPENPRIADGVEKGVDCFDYLAEADLRSFAAELLKDLLNDLIAPLHLAVRTGRELLSVRELGSAAQPSEVARWPEHDLIPRRFQPAGNDFLLESVETYPVTYTRTVGAKTRRRRTRVAPRRNTYGTRSSDPDRSTAMLRVSSRSTRVGCRRSRNFRPTSVRRPGRSSSSRRVPRQSSIVLAISSMIETR